MSTQELKFEPMSAGMLLDRAFRLYTQNFLVMVGATACVNVPYLLLVTLLALSASFSGSSILTLAATVLGGLAVLIASFIVTPLVTGAITKVVSERYLGNTITIRSALREALDNVGTLILTQLVVGLIVMVGLVLFVVPGIIWMLSYALVAPIIMLESSSDREEIRQRSWELVAGNRGKVFTVLFVVIVVQLLMGIAGGVIIAMFVSEDSPIFNGATNIISNIATTLVYPLQATAVTLLYYDFRIRKEGFDLEMLSKAIGDTGINT